MVKAAVISVIDGDTFRINPQWKFSDKTGGKIRIVGLDEPELSEPGAAEVKRKLEKLILGKQIEYKPIKLSFDRLLATVYLKETDISTLL